MLNAWINTQKVWYAFYIDEEPILDDNGDLTGEYTSGYSAPLMTRANLSPARGIVDDDIFGSNVQYTKTMSTAKMNLGIDERTLLWDKPPVLLGNGNADPESADYRVARVAKGHYHVHYALQQLNHNDAEEVTDDEG